MDTTLSAVVFYSVCVACFTAWSIARRLTPTTCRIEFTDPNLGTVKISAVNSEQVIRILEGLPKSAVRDQMIKGLQA